MSQMLQLHHAILCKPSPLGSFPEATPAVAGSSAQRYATAKSKAWRPRFRPLQWKRPVARTMCQSELELTAIQEFADGSLHFTFGAPSTSGTSSKGHELSSSHAEHISSMAIPSVGRLPSCFVKKSPIPLSTSRKRRHLGGNKNSKVDTDISEAARDSEGRSLSTRRPRSSFVKKIPITRHKRENASTEPSNSSRSTPSLSVKPDLSESSSGSVTMLGGGESSKKNGIQSSKGTSQNLPADDTAGIEKLEKGKMPHKSVLKRLPSKFVRRSPVPPSARKVFVEGVSSCLQSTQNGATAASVSHINLKGSRPKAKFVKRSPIPSTGRRCSLSLKTGVTIDPSIHLHVVQESESTSTKKGAKVMKAVSESGSLEGTVSVADLPADLNQYKLIELRTIAKSRGLKGYTRLKKSELIDLLRQSMS